MGKLRDWKVIELNPEGSKEWNFYIPYVYMTKEYGRAEFSICTKWKRGRISDIWISRMQQKEGCGELYHINVVSKSRSLSFGYESHVWFSCWCQEHKAQNLRAYVPNNTDMLLVSLLSDVSFMFIKRKENETELDAVPQEVEQ